MDEVISKGLEGALRAAVESNGSAGRGGAPMDLMGLAIKVLPRLLESAGEREELIEVQKQGLEDLRRQMSIIRRQQRELTQSFSEIFKEIKLMSELQSALVTHLARVQLLDLPDNAMDYDDDSERPRPQTRSNRRM